MIVSRQWWLRHLHEFTDCCLRFLHGVCELRGGRVVGYGWLMMGNTLGDGKSGGSSGVMKEGWRM